MFPNAKQNKRGRIFDNLNSKMCSAVCRLTFRCRLDYHVQYVVPGAVYIIYGADLDRGL